MKGGLAMNIEELLRALSNEEIIGEEDYADSILL